jgi:hypothetical protein
MVPLFATFVRPLPAMIAVPAVPSAVPTEPPACTVTELGLAALLPPPETRMPAAPTSPAGTGCPPFVPPRTVPPMVKAIALSAASLPELCATTPIEPWPEVEIALPAAWPMLTAPPSP